MTAIDDLRTLVERAVMETPVDHAMMEPEGDRTIVRVHFPTEGETASVFQAVVRLGALAGMDYTLTADRSELAGYSHMLVVSP